MIGCSNNSQGENKDIEKLSKDEYISRLESTVD
jgi:hypothetical protein